MKFENALRALKKGKKIARLNWKDYIILKHDNIYINNSIRSVEIITEDILAEDWEIVE